MKLLKRLHFKEHEGGFEDQGIISVFSHGKEGYYIEVENSGWSSKQAAVINDKLETTTDMAMLKFIYIALQDENMFSDYIVSKLGKKEVII